MSRVYLENLRSNDKSYVDYEGNKMITNDIVLSGNDSIFQRSLRSFKNISYNDIVYNGKRSRIMTC